MSAIGSSDGPSPVNSTVFSAGTLLGGQGSITPTALRTGPGITVSGGMMSLADRIVLPWGPRWVDIRDYGAVPNDPAYDETNSLAIQAAHDALCHPNSLNGGENPQNYAGVVYVPTGTWFMRWPVIFDGDYLWLVGDGPSSMLKMNQNASPPIILGMKRAAWWKSQAAGGHLWDVATHDISGNRVDMSTLSVPTGAPVGAPNQRWALRSKQPGTTNPYADHFFQFVSIPPANGGNTNKANWDQINKFSMSFLFGGGIDGTGPVHPTGTGHSPALCGHGQNPQQAPNRAGPWILMAGDHSAGPDGKYHFYFNLDKGNASEADYTLRHFRFGDVSATGMQLIEIEMDLTQNDSSGHCYICVYINGVQVEVLRGAGAGWGGPSFTAEDDLHFRPNEYQIFNVFTLGNLKNSQLGAGEDYIGIFSGFALYNTIRYQNLGAGQAQARRNAGTLSTYHRLFAEADNPDIDSLICLMPMTDPPHDPNRTSDMFITVRNRDGNTYHGLISENTLEKNYHLIKSNELHNLRIEGWEDSGAGIAVMCAVAFHCRMQECEFEGGWNGIWIHSGYDYNIIDCVFTGYGPQLLASTALLRVHGYKGRPTTFHSLMTLMGCNADIRDIKTGIMDPGCKHLFKFIGDGGYGGKYELDKIETDQEGAPGPDHSLIWISEHADAHNTQLHVKNVISGGAPDTTPIIKAVSRPGGTPCHLVLERLQSGGKIAVWIHGTSWEGEIIDCIAPEPIEWVRNEDPAAAGKVVSYHRMAALPTTKIWAAGSNVVELFNPGPGGVRRYVCSTSGTGTDARWAPLERLGTPIQAP